MDRLEQRWWGVCRSRLEKKWNQQACPKHTVKHPNQLRIDHLQSLRLRRDSRSIESPNVDENTNPKHQGKFQIPSSKEVPARRWGALVLCTSSVGGIDIESREAKPDGRSESFVVSG